jgi:hypothetical protein
MPGIKKPSRFTQSEVARAVRGVTATGVSVDRVVIEGSKIIVFPKQQNGKPSDADEIIGKLQ